MKKCFLIMLVLVLTLAFAAPALAADPITTEGGTGSTNVTYTAATTFTVTIPDSVALGDSGNVVLAADHVLPIGKNLNIAITGARNESGGKWYVKGAGEKTFEYTIKDNGADIAKEAKILLKETTADTDNFAEVTKSLAFAFADGVSATFAGDYTDQLTFTVTLDEIVP